MIKAKGLLFGLFLFSFYWGFGQSDTITGKDIRFSSVKIAYNSSLIYPGLRLGIESPIQSTVVNRSLKSGELKSFTKNQYLSANLSWYHHPGFHDNVYLTLGWTLRRTNARGWFWEFSPEAGLSRTFLGGTTYKVSENGTISIERFAGYYYALVSAGGGLGYDFSVKKSKPFQLFYKFNLLSMFPYNSTIYLRPAMEIGINYKIPHFLPMKTKLKKINR